MIGGKADRTTLAVVLIVASVLLLSGVDALVKTASAKFSLWQIYTARSFFSVIILLSLSRYLGAGGWSAAAKSWVLARSLLFVGASIAFYSALPETDLSLAATALYTTPLFIALLSPLLANEHVSRGSWFGILLGFVGVLVILRPGSSNFSFWTLLPIAAALFYALSVIVTRTKCSAENPLVLALSMHAILLVVGIVGTVLIGTLGAETSSSFLVRDWHPMSAQDWLLMLSLGAAMVAVGVGVAKAYQMGAPAVVGTFDYCYLVFAVLWGVIFFAELPDWITIAGIALIIAAGTVVLSQGMTKQPG